MQIVVKLHSRCNLNCSYCYMYNKGDDSFRTKPKRLSQEVISRLPEMINHYLQQDQIRSVALCMHGGEPLLVGKHYFLRMMQFLSETLDPDRVRFSLQTNATLVDADWISIFEKYRINVSASLDGPPQINDRARHFHNGLGSSKAAEQGIKRLIESKVNFAGVICVVNPDANGAAIVDYFAEDLKVIWFDLLLPDFTHDEIRGTDWLHTQKKLLAVMTSAFDRWFDLPNAPECRFFESVVARFFGHKSVVDTIGKDGVSTVVLETDGELEPHDVARICSDLDRKTGLQVRAGSLDEILSHPNFLALQNLQSSFSPRCRDCRNFAICRGGHFFHRHSKENGFDNPSVHCDVLFSTIDYIHDALAARVDKLQSGRKARVNAGESLVMG